jgi:hypothetical protein
MAFFRDPPPDPVIDRFRDGMAVLRRGGEVCGHVATSVGFFSTPWRPRSRQPWVWFIVVWSDGTRERPFEDYPPWTWVSEMTAGIFEWDGHAGDPRSGTYDVEWLSEDDTASAWEERSISPQDF